MAPASARESIYDHRSRYSFFRLLVGLTWGGNGAWTSWPPHEHEKDLEEVYWVTLIWMITHFGLHLSYVEPGDTHG